MSAELDIEHNVQLESSSSSSSSGSTTEDLQELQDHGQGLLQDSSPSVGTFVHLAVQNQAPSSPAGVRVKVLGSLCRFQGYQPLSGCPIESLNGCVDRLPCSRKCAVDGYFNYRCVGPRKMTPKELTEYYASQAPATPKPKPYVTNDDYIRELSGRIQKAIEKADYSTLARLVVDAQGTSVGKLAANALAQMSSEVSTRTPAEEGDAENGLPEDLPVVMDGGDAASQAATDDASSQVLAQDSSNVSEAESSPVVSVDETV